MRADSFGSMGAFLDGIERLPLGPNAHDGSDWDGGASAVEAARMGRRGWPDGARLAAAVVERLADRTIMAQSADTMEPVIGYDVCGAAYDAGAYGTGTPECWSTLKPTEAKRALHMVMNISASGGVSADALRARGIAMAALVMVLQAKGHPVTVDAVIVTRERGGGAYELRVRVVDAADGSQLDVDRLVFALGHPGFFRHLTRAHVDGSLGGGGAERWGTMSPADDAGGCDLYLGGAHLHQVERWSDGGEAWVLREFLRQTTAA